MKINKKKIKHASVSLLFILFFAAFVMLANVLVDFMSTRFSLKIDMTPNQLYQLDDSTKEMLSQMEDEVTIYMLKEETQMQQGNYYYILETIYQMATASGGKIKYEFISPTKNPAFFDKYANAKGNENALLIVASDKRYKVVNSNEMLAAGQTSSGQANNTVYVNVESAIDTALLFVQSDRPTKAGLVTGHSEIAVEGFNELLSSNGMEQVQVNLLSEEIPEDVTNLIIMAPTIDFAASEIEKLDKFLEVDGNNIFVFWNFLAPKLEVLERYLTEWGIAVGPEIILDQQQAYQMPAGIFAQYTDNDATQSMAANQETRIFLPYCRPLEMLWAEKSYTRVVPMANTSNQSYARLMTDDADIYAAKQSGERSGPFYPVIMSEKNQQKPGGKLEYNSSRIFVFGSYVMVDETALPILSNQSFITALVGYGNDSMKTMQVMPKVIKNEDLNIYQSSMSIYWWVLVVIMPLIILAAGIYIFIHRRYK